MAQEYRSLVKVKVAGCFRTIIGAAQDARINSFFSTVRKQRFNPFTLWVECFPLIFPPLSGDGIGLIILNSNAETNFSFTNALGIVAAEDVRAALEIIGQYPNAGWIVALHHHLMEYPMPVKAFSERIGTALINGSWFVRALKPVAHRVVVMHGHRHIDWMGSTGALKVVSAPSPVKGSGKDCDPYFYIHNLTVGQAGRINLLPPDRIDVGEGVSLSSQGA